MKSVRTCLVALLVSVLVSARLSALRYGWIARLARTARALAPGREFVRKLVGFAQPVGNRRFDLVAVRDVHDVDELPRRFPFHATDAIQE